MTSSSSPTTCIFRVPCSEREEAEEREGDCGNRAWGRCERSGRKTEKINTETNMVDLTKVVYLELWKERRQAEAEAAALKHKQTRAESLGGADIYWTTHRFTHSRARPHAQCSSWWRNSHFKQTEAGNWRYRELYNDRPGTRGKPKCRELWLPGCQPLLHQTASILKTTYLSHSHTLTMQNTSQNLDSALQVEASHWLKQNIFLLTLSTRRYMEVMKITLSPAFLTLQRETGVNLDFFSIGTVFKDR